MSPGASAKTDAALKIPAIGRIDNDNVSDAGDKGLDRTCREGEGGKEVKQIGRAHV